MRDMKKIQITVGFLTAVLLFSLFPTGSAAAGPFPDVESGDWYCEAVEYLTGLGILNGYPDGCFHPDDPLTEAQFLKMIFANLAESVSEGEAWWEPWFRAAEQAGLVTEEDRAKMEEPVTRYRAAELLAGLELLTPEEQNRIDRETIRSEIKDFSEIPEPSREAILLTYGAGILLGSTDGCYHGGDELNRAQGAIIVLRLSAPDRRTPRLKPVAPERKPEGVLVLGNSLTLGLAEHGGLTGVEFLSSNGGSIYALGKTAYTLHSGGEAVPMTWLKSHRYDQIVLVFGTNEMWNIPYFAQNYRSVLKEIAELQPGCRMIVCSVPPINENLMHSDVYCNVNVQAMNAAIGKIANDLQIEQFDSWSLFADKAGSLPAEKTGDGIHMKAAAYREWGTALAEILGLT